MIFSIEMENELYQRFSNLTDQLIVLTDNAGMIQFVNTAAENLLGNQVDELVRLDDILIKNNDNYTLLNNRSVANLQQ